jgi:transcription initiation factor TFIID subunit 6
MSLIPAEMIRVIAESNGHPRISDEVVSQVAVDLEYRLREILQDSIKMMKHSKRTLLTTEDINSVLSLQNYEILYGFSFNNPLNFLRVVGQKDLFCIEGDEIDIKDLLNDPLPQAPEDVLLQSHWLAINGVQPATVQNLDSLPPIGSDEVKSEPLKVGEKRKADSKKEEKGEIPRNAKHVLSKELELYYTKVTEVVKAVGKHTGELKGTELGKLYNSILNSVSQDIGLHQLVPYFSLFIVTEVANNLTNLRHLQSVMHFTDYFFTNPNFRIEPYLDQLMPSILSCLLGKNLCSVYTENHWALRDYVAKNLLPKACKIGRDYFDFHSKVIKTLASTFLDMTKPIPTHYGAIKGLESLGEKVVQIVIIPNISGYIKMLNLKKESMGTIMGMPQQFMIELATTRDALLEIACNYCGSIAQFYHHLYSLLCIKNSIEPDESLSKVTEMRRALPGQLPAKNTNNNNSNANNNNITTEEEQHREEAELSSNPLQSMNFIHDLIRQEVQRVGADHLSIQETFALGELAEVGKRFHEMSELFGEDFTKSKKISEFTDFFNQSDEWIHAIQQVKQVKQEKEEKLQQQQVKQEKS